MARDLDSYITGGRYHSEYLIVTCSECEEHTIVLAETEYGSTWWTPEECKYCHEYFDENTNFQESSYEEEFYREIS